MSTDAYFPYKSYQRCRSCKHIWASHSSRRHQGVDYPCMAYGCWNCEGFEPKEVDMATKRGESKITKFWMVCRDPNTVMSHNPKNVYRNIETARVAAGHLARDLNARVYLLESVSWVEPAEPPMRWGSVDAEEVDPDLAGGSE